MSLIGRLYDSVFQKDVDRVCVNLFPGPVEITSAELSHAGRYSCTAKNAAGSTQRHVQLMVQGKNIWRNSFFTLRFCCV